MVGQKVMYWILEVFVLSGTVFFLSFFFSLVLLFGVI